MMNQIFGLLSLLFCVQLSAAFQVNGTIKGYTNQPIFIKLIKDVSPEIVAKAITDEEGSFFAKIPLDYTGLIFLETPTGVIIEMIAENKDISLTGTLSGREIKDIAYTKKGDVNNLFLNFKSFAEYERVQNEVFPFLNNLYSDSDDFGKAIAEEDKRITEKLEDFKKMTENKGFLTYYMEGSERLKGWTANKDKVNKNEIKMLLAEDNTNLEKARFLEAYLLKYLEALSKTATSQEDFEEKILKGIDELLASENMSDNRKVNILTSSINILKAEQFPAVNGSLMNSLTTFSGKKTDEAKRLIELQNIAVGKKAPDFMFASQNGAKSLYSTKAKKKLLVFWASWCPACVNEMPFVEEYYNDFKKEGGEIIAVSLDYDEAAFNKAVADYAWINHSDLMKWDGPTSRKFGINSTPTLMLLDENNVILKIANGLGEILE